MYMSFVNAYNFKNYIIMKILVKHISELLNDKLTLNQRGILITILLLNDENPKITLAKAKVKIKFSKNKEDLIYLHESGYIQWSGIKAAKKSLQAVQATPDVLEAVNFMNRIYKRNFDPTSISTTKELRNRLMDYSLDQIKIVIANRYVEWKDNPDMSKHLNPTTIFRKSKFEKYIEEAERTRQGEGLMKAEKFDLKSNDKLTIKNIKSLVDVDIYSIKTYRLNAEGGIVGTGVTTRKTGKATKNLVTIQNNRIKRNEQAEEFYVYKE